MKSILMTAIRFYRRWISPAKPGSCRFHPTCSAYAQEALEGHGAWKGTLLTLGRLLKCHPFHPGGVDPVPEKKDGSKFQISNSRSGRDVFLGSGIWGMKSNTEE